MTGSEQDGLRTLDRREVEADPVLAGTQPKPAPVHSSPQARLGAGHTGHSHALREKRAIWGFRAIHPEEGNPCSFLNRIIIMDPGG